MHNFREIKPVYGQVDRPLRKREPLYKFLKTTMEKTDVNKQKIRNIMSSVVWKFCQKHGNKVCRMLTMPGTEWIFEKMLRTNLLRSGIRSSITACELDYKVFCIACANAPGTKTRNPYFSNKLNHYVMTNVKNQIYMLNMDIFDSDEQRYIQS